MPESGSVSGMPLVPPSQPTQAPGWVAITGRSAVTRPPGESSQPSSPRWRGSRLATAITGLSLVTAVSAVTGLSCINGVARAQAIPVCRGAVNVEQDGGYGAAHDLAATRG